MRGVALRLRAKFSLLLLISILLPIALRAQGAPPPAPAVIKPGDNLVVENIPPVPAAIAEKANQYGEFRAASIQDWDPVKREMLIGTRFADVPQIHLVKMPGGARSQLTFFRSHRRRALRSQRRLLRIQQGHRRRRVVS